MSQARSLTQRERQLLLLCVGVLLFMGTLLVTNTLLQKRAKLAAKIAELEKQKQEAIDLMAVYQLRLDTYKRIIGIKWATFTVEDGLYTFQDSCTFDLMTHEFRFPASSRK
jgi:hypothetical protein